MTLNQNNSLWRDSCIEQVNSRQLSGYASADLIIVGGGFTGASAALEATKAGMSVCLVEANEIGFGGSGRNVGLVNAGLWLPPSRVFEIMGEAEGAKLIGALSVAPDKVFSLINDHDINCESVRNGTLHCAHSSSGLKDIEDRFRQGRRMGAPYQVLDASETHKRTGSDGFRGALFDPRAGTIQPLSYCRGLIRAAQERGAKIFEHSPAKAITFSNNSWRVECAGGHIIGSSLLIATNAYHIDVDGPFRPHFTKVGYFQCATAPLKDKQLAKILPGREGCWDTALVMSSFRLDASGRLIIGGVGRLDTPAAQIHIRWARNKLADLFPDLTFDQFDYSWTGQIAMTSDHIPKIVEIGPNALACFGYSGRGIGPGTVFGAAASRALRENDFSHLPVTPIRSYKQRFTALSAPYYELGALMVHASGCNI